MHKQLGIGLLVGAIVCGGILRVTTIAALAGNAEKAARIALAQEFVRGLEIIYRMQETAKKEFAEDSSGPGKTNDGHKGWLSHALRDERQHQRLSMIMSMLGGLSSGTRLKTSPRANCTSRLIQSDCRV